MEFKGTKGEWSVEHRYDDHYNQPCFEIVSDSSENFVTIWSGGVITKEHEANAKLIAASPTLLEALQWLIDNALHENTMAMEVAEEAIKKAT